MRGAAGGADCGGHDRHRTDGRVNDARVEGCNAEPVAATALTCPWDLACHDEEQLGRKKCLKLPVGSQR